MKFPRSRLEKIRENRTFSLDSVHFVETWMSLETVQTCTPFLSFSSPFQGRREPIKENCLINDRTSDGQNRLETERQRRYSFSRYNPPHYFYRPAAMSIGKGRGRRRSLSLSLSRDSNFRGKLRGFSLEMLGFELLKRKTTRGF